MQSCNVGVLSIFPPFTVFYGQIPIHNNGDVAWTLNAGPRQPPFAGPNQLTVPARGKVRFVILLMFYY